MQPSPYGDVLNRLAFGSGAFRFFETPCCILRMLAVSDSLSAYVSTRLRASIQTGSYEPGGGGFFKAQLRCYPMAFAKIF